MDKKLIEEYLYLGEEILATIREKNLDLPTAYLKEKSELLQGIIKTIQIISRRLADIGNVVNQVLYLKSRKFHSHIDPYPYPGEHGCLVGVGRTKKEVVPGLDLPVSIVDDEKEIPSNISLYYLKASNQFAVQLNGFVISGNIGNLLQHKGTLTAACTYGDKCKNLLKRHSCTFHHDDIDYKRLQIKPPKNNFRNFTYGSWIYSRNKKGSYRHVGNRDTLIEDLSNTKNSDYSEELRTREAQLMHDILVYLSMIQFGMSHKFPDWGNYSSQIAN